MQSQVILGIISHLVLNVLPCQELHMSAVHLSYDPAGLPLSWELSSGLLSPVVDQGWCDNSWAVSALAVAADRQETVSHGKYQSGRGIEIG